MNISFLKEKGNKYLIWILLGVLLLVLAIPINKEEEKVFQTTYDSSVEEGRELQLKKVLSAMDGVGKVEVMITTKNTQNAGSFFTTEQNSNDVCGVVIVAEGAGTPTIDARITDAVLALFPIDVHRISIVKMTEQEEGR
ncbi:MAG: hypothetical protein IKJ01_00060 [Lachnospiraceae bacterium]|nr:hypothetical protein [Lachnospiraceae bacterium]